MKTLAVMALPLLLLAVPATAADISTHVLDLAKGVGGRDVPVTLSKKTAEGGWVEVARTRTDENGRVRSFGDPARFDAGVYRLHFDMSAAPNAQTASFFPEMTLTFRVDDPKGHYHVPIVVSPYGYSTYRGN